MKLPSNNSYSSDSQTVALCKVTNDALASVVVSSETLRNLHEQTMIFRVSRVKSDGRKRGTQDQDARRSSRRDNNGSLTSRLEGEHTYFCIYVKNGPC